MCIQTGVTLWNSSIWVKIVDFSARVILKLARWHRKTITQFFYATINCVHQSVPICECKLELGSGNAQIAANCIWPLLLWPLMSDFDLLHEHSNKNNYTTTLTKLKGGILFSPCPSAHPSISLSVCGQNRVRSVSSTILHFIFAHLIKQLQYVCSV